MGSIAATATTTEIGVPLKEIKARVQTHSPENARQLFEQQDGIVRQKIKRLLRLQSMIGSCLSRLEEGKHAL